MYLFTTAGRQGEGREMGGEQGCWYGAFPIYKPVSDHVSPLCLDCNTQGDWEPKRNVQGTDAFNAWQREKPDYYLANLATGAQLPADELRGSLTAHMTACGIMHRMGRRADIVAAFVIVLRRAVTR